DQATWTANVGAHYFVDAGDKFQLPDLRNMFRRYTGTDADTANARVFGSYQSDAFQAHMMGSIQVLSGGQDPVNVIQSTYELRGGRLLDGWPLVGVYGQIVDDFVHGVPRTGYETRPLNVAYAPRLHI
ncbi:hypothetical protein ACGVWS_15970, partial [Enterobacteriaceae bacterium LUAb1]